MVSTELENYLFTCVTLEIDNCKEDLEHWVKRAKWWILANGEKLDAEYLSREMKAECQVMARSPLSAPNGHRASRALRDFFNDIIPWDEIAAHYITKAKVMRLSVI